MTRCRKRHNLIGAICLLASVATAHGAWAAGLPQEEANASDLIGTWSDIAQAGSLPLRGGYGQQSSARTPAQSCIAAISIAEARYGIPKGLLQAIAKVETGRPDPSTGRIEPWPWAVNVDNQGLYFQNLEQSVRWVRRMETTGVTSIDTGCLQVNLQQHPAAFRTIEDAFDPIQNADYAARFLVQLQRETGDWIRAAGLYHSRTPALSENYRSKVQHVFAGTAETRQQTARDQLKSAWASTIPSRADSTGVSGWQLTSQAHPLQARAKHTSIQTHRTANQRIRLAGP
jgi:hypothetical protein